MFFLSDDPLFSDEELLLMCAASGGKTVEDTATGNPLTFTTDISKPLKSLLIPFTPIQSGTGDPSPQNIRSILPWNGLSVGQINGTAPVISNNSGMANADGEWKNTVTDSKARFDAYIQLYKDSTYIKGVGNKSISASGIYSITFNVDDANCNRIVFLHSGSLNNLSVRFPFNLPQGTYTISFNVVSANPSIVGGLSIKDIFLVAGGDVQRTQTDISFPSPVYGGTLDVVSGVLTVDKAYQLLNDADKWTQLTAGQTVDFSYEQDFERKLYDGSLTGLTCSAFLALVNQNVAYCRWRGATNLKFGIKNGNSMATPLTLEDVKQMATNGEIAICYDIEPQTVQLTGEQLTALIGNNTIWSDADGSMTAVYLKNG